LGIYQIFAERGKGLMISAELGEVLAGATAQGKEENGYIHFHAGTPDEHTAANELIKSGHIADPEVIEQFQRPPIFLADGLTFNPDYLNPLPEPGRYPADWGALKESTPIDNGVYFVSSENGGGIAVHKDVAAIIMSEYAVSQLNQSHGDYHYYDYKDSAAIAVFELSRSHPKVLDLITSWDSLMHTLATEHTGYSDKWNYISEPDNHILDAPAPSNMFLQRHLDEAAAHQSVDMEHDDDNFFEPPGYFEQEP
jgi:hypothetical protein